MAQKRKWSFLTEVVKGWFKKVFNPRVKKVKKLTLKEVKKVPFQKTGHLNSGLKDE